jgi:GDP-D-mannose dehydratase
MAYLESHVTVSFETPEYTVKADGLGTPRILEAIRMLGFARKELALPSGAYFGDVWRGAGGSRSTIAPESALLTGPP